MCQNLYYSLHEPITLSSGVSGIQSINFNQIGSFEKKLLQQIKNSFAVTKSIISIFFQSLSLPLSIHCRKQPPEEFCKKSVLKIPTECTGRHLCHGLFINKVAGLLPLACNFIKKQTLTRVFSCEFCEIFKNTFFYKTSPVAAFD